MNPPRFSREIALYIYVSFDTFINIIVNDVRRTQIMRGPENLPITASQSITEQKPQIWTVELVEGPAACGQKGKKG